MGRVRLERHTSSFSRHLASVGERALPDPCKSVEHNTIYMSRAYPRVHSRTQHAARLIVEFASMPRKADCVWTTLSRIFSFSKDRGADQHQPLQRRRPAAYGKSYGQDLRDEDVAAFLGSAAPELTPAMVLALWTGQRQGDLLRLLWPAYHDGRIRFQQSKTGRRARRLASL